METKELLKEAVKAEVVKLMAQELLKEDSFEKMKSELAAELFELKETEPTVNVTDKPEDKKVFIRELNSNWGYDPINKQEENLKQMLGFLPNMKDIGRGFKGQEISLEEKLFMENSSFTKMRLINELKEKIKDLEQSVPFNMPYIENINEDEEGEIESSSEKLKDFKTRIYGDKSEIPKPIIGHQMAEYVLNKQKEKLGESFSSYITEHYKDIIIPEASGATEDIKTQTSSNVPDFILKAKDKASEALESAIKIKRTPIKKTVGVVKEPSKKSSVKKASSKKKTNKK
jgi:hypothetical protein